MRGLPSEGLLRRVKRFRRAIERLARLKRYSREELLSDEDKLDILENLDVGRYIIAAQQLP